jgi:FkbM family methyltransferase
MKFLKILRLFRKCFGDARWGKYTTFSDKFEVFRVLFALHYHVEITNRQGEATLRIFQFTVVSPSYFELLFLFREIFIDQQYAVTLNHENPLIIDCGANVGLATLFFKRLAPECKLICFEPNPKAFNYLKRNVEANNLKDVQLVNAGLSDVKGTIPFFVDDNNTLVSSLDKNRTRKHELQVESTTLSSYLQNQFVCFVKVDVEGAEWQILKDLINTNTISNVGEFAFEYHHNLEGSQHRLAEFLTLLEQSNFYYNISASYLTKGQFQDILIRAYSAK